MAIKVLKGRGSSASSIARTLGVTEGAVRYHLRRQASGAVDGRAGKARKASRWHEAISSWLGSRAEDAVRHYEGEATEHVLPPTPLGRMGRRLQEIALLAPEQRPLDLHAALAEVAR